MIPLPKVLQKLPFARVVIVLFLLLLVIVGAGPSYLGGQWPWQRSAKVATLKQLRDLRKQGLEVPGWQVKDRQLINISESKWVYQEMVAAGTSEKAQDNAQKIALLLLPQNTNSHQPQVEWTDIKSSQRWKTDSLKRSSFSLLDSPSTRVEFQFLRAWNERQTYAVSQWYAWPGTGSPSPGQWFWADQAAQLQGKRLPWVAVSVLMPIEPLGNIDQVLQQAQSIGQSVQSALMAGPLK